MCKMNYETKRLFWKYCKDVIFLYVPIHLVPIKIYKKRSVIDSFGFQFYCLDYYITKIFEDLYKIVLTIIKR